jgi:hypothetical protein
MTNDSKYAAFGMTAILPGLIRAVEVLQTEIDSIRATLAALESGTRQRGTRRPKGDAQGLTSHGKPVKDGYWARLSAGRTQRGNGETGGGAEEKAKGSDGGAKSQTR